MTSRWTQDLHENGRAWHSQFQNRRAHAAPLAGTAIRWVEHVVRGLPGFRMMVEGLAAHFR